MQSAYVKFLNAQTDYDALTSPPEEDEIVAAQLAVEEKTLALQQAELDLMDVGDGQTAATREAALSLEKAELQLASAQETSGWHDIGCTVFRNNYHRQCRSRGNSQR